MSHSAGSAATAPEASVATRVLAVTAVAAERDAVTRAAPGTYEVVALPGGQPLHRLCHPSAPDDSAAPAVLLDVLAAGVGPAAAATGTATALTAAALADTPYHLVISAGIGGAFVPSEGTGTPAAPPVGTGVVVATAVVAADLGVRTADGFQPVTELGFGTVRHLPPAALVRAVATATGAVPGEVLTVSTVTGTAARAAELAARHPRAAVEAMEGFGVAEAAAAHGVPVLEVRTVSNTVGPRDRDAWRIPAALHTLGRAFEMMVPVLADLADRTGWDPADGARADGATDSGRST